MPLDDNEELLPAVARLQRISRLIRLTGLYVFTFTLLGIIGLAWLTLGPLGKIIPLYLRTAVTISALLACFAAVVHEQLRKTGDGLFEEISEEVHWNLRGSSTSSPKGEYPVALDKPRLQIRLVLREFARNTDLPLVAGSRGAVFYVGLNILVLIAELAFIWRVMHF